MIPAQLFEVMPAVVTMLMVVVTIASLLEGRL